MLEAWELIRHVAEVLGMVFLPILGWMLVTLTQHSKKIILLEERVNETITKRLSSLEKSFDDIDAKVDKSFELINRVNISVEHLTTVFDDKYHKIDSILEQINKLSGK